MARAGSRGGAYLSDFSTPIFRHMALSIADDATEKRKRVL
jgi:hypothetical protein